MNNPTIPPRLSHQNHRVSFDEAKSVFYDDYATQFFDKESSTMEDRFLMLGMSSQARILVVCHCERNGANTIRIISARKVTHTESKFYRSKKP